MKNKKFCFPGLLVLLMICSGCASSDRMVRMSGGVLDEYSAPPKHRIRSERFQVKSDVIAPAERGKREAVSDFNTPLVNVWPFFFRSSNYFSILWPFIDWDPYGVAIRPFYNQEGDEYSILFPLSAWNNVNRDGWILNFAWNKDGFGFVPFSWQHDSKDEFWCYYTPLFIYSKNRRPMTVLTSQDDMSAFFMLWYMNRKYKKQFSQDMTRCYYGSTIPVKRYIAAKNKWAFPKKPNPTKEEMAEFKKKIYDMAPVTTETNYGIFPLFNISKNDDGYTLRALAYLMGLSRYKCSSGWDVLNGLLASYECNEYSKFPNGAGSWKKREAFKFLYLFQQNSEEYYPDNEVFKTFRRVSDAARHGNSFSFQLDQVSAELAKCSPGTVIPPEVTDYSSLWYFIDDWEKEYAKGKVFKTAVRRNGGFMPLFWYWTDVDKYIWFSAAGLSRYSRDKDGFAFWSIPLLTFMYESKSSDFSFKGIAPPFLWMSFDKHREAVNIPVKTRDTKFVQSWECAETVDDYGICGLFYKGKTRFYVAKEGADVQEIKKLRDACYGVSRNFSSIKRMREKYEIEFAKVVKWKPENKIDHYKKLIREEELKETLAEINKCEQKNSELIKNAQKSAASLKFRFNADELRSSDGLDKVSERIFEQLAEIREKEDIGNGFIFRKEKFYNGDYKWRLLWFLAGGEKQEKRESVQVLHFLYRRRTDGDKSETLFFPFVSVVKDGKKERFSFLGRIWQKSSVDGKSGGYIFFIPWGDKNCH